MDKILINFEASNLDSINEPVGLANLHIFLISSFKSETRHIRNRYNFIKQSIEEGDITLKYQATNEILADFLTKPAGRRT